MSKQPGRFYQFDSFLVDTSRRALLRGGEPVPLKPKAFETLLALVENRGRVVEKDELMRSLWPDTFVEEANLTQHISLVRKALGDDPKEHRFILTVSGRGYRFVADVREFQKGLDETQTTHKLMVEADETSDAGDAGEDVTASTPQVRRVEGASGRTPRRRLLALIASALAFALVVFIVWRTRTEEAGNDLPIKSIAVLPFKTLDGKNEDEYLSLGLTDNLISRFNGLRQVTVRQMNEVLKYGKPDQDPIAAGRALAVDAVLDGIAQKTGDRLRVTARLLDVKTGETLWAQTFDEHWTDVFSVQDALSMRVSESLAWNLNTADRQRLTKRYTNNLEAYEFYLKGERLGGKRTAESLTKSIQYLQRAIELDSGFVLAYISLAQNYIEPIPFMTAKEALQRRKELFLKALELDSACGQAYAGLGITAWRVDLNWDEAERLLRRAIELEPNNPYVHNNYGVFLASRGQVEAGINELSQAHSLSPTNIGIMSVLGTLHIYARHYDDAIARNREALEMEPDYAVALNGLGWAYGNKGLYTEAFKHLEKAAELEERRGSNVLAILGHFYALAGRRDDALKTLDGLKQLQEQGRGSWGALAVVYAALGEKDKAFACLDKALENSEWWASSIKVNPVFDSLRSDPRFEVLLRKLFQGTGRS
jgi:DNA-binding winged helix-turn-helix (wHTH) protein/TolB-like protein/Tfp pilus assembly protein PilF